MSRFNFIARQKNKFQELSKKSWLCLIVSKKHINLFLIVLIIFIGIVYLLQTNHMSIEGYKIKDLENKIQELQENNKKLHLKIDEKQSLSYINNKLVNLTMTEKGRIDYLSAKSGSVAVK